MGLPIWRDPDEQAKRKSCLKADPTAAQRSSIRRRPSVHGSRNRRLTRDPSFVPPRIAPSPPPPPPAAISVRYSRRNGVPPIQSLLEHADRALPPPPPPPPVPLSRNYYTLEQRERELRDSLDQLHAQAASLRRDAHDFIQGPGEHTSDPWTETERRTLLETASVAQARRPGLQRTRTHRAQPASSHESSESRRDDRSRQSSLAPTAPVIDGPVETLATALPRTLLPTPPLDQSEPDGDSLFIPEGRSTVSRPLHPLSRSWRADSPVNGLGDRNRSPTPTDAWEIMETTIPPDTALVSAESSFATARATSSFASSNDTTITEPEQRPRSSNGEISRRRWAASASHHDSDIDSASSFDVDCTEEEYVAQAEAFAREMYEHEMSTAEGRARVVFHWDYDRSMTPVGMGFRLIDSALNTAEGRERVARLGGEDAIHRMVRFRDTDHRTNQNHNDTQPQTHPNPPRQSHSPPSYPTSPPSTSLDPPSANPVSPPNNNNNNTDTTDPDPDPDRHRRAASDFNDLLMNIDDEQQDLDAMRRVARRLATREEVPDDWWASMGLRLNSTTSTTSRHVRHANGSANADGRARARRRSPDGVRRADMRGHVERGLGRVRGGRVERERERGDARL